MTNPSIPLWLLEVKDDITKSSEWNELTRHIYDAVDQHLSQNHIQYFTDLTDAEKILLLERAARSLESTEGGNLYENLQSRLSYVLDQSVNNQVAKKLLEDNPLETKTDLVLDTTCEGVITLLRKYPEQKHKLHVFLNQSIPQPLRFLAWQLFLANLKVRKEFITRLAADPKSCLSPQDTEIQRKCENLLQNGVTFREYRDSRGNSNSMKGILSYYHMNLRTNRSLQDPEYLFVMPFVAVHYPALPKNESPTERSMSSLVEMYIQFASTLPAGIEEGINSNRAGTNEMENLVKSVIAKLEQYDLEFLDFLKDLSRKTSPPGIEEITFLTAMKTTCAPLMQSLFSGFLSMEPLMFVWDQYVISIDIPGYHEELIPIVCAVILMLLRDQIMACKSFLEVDECIRHQSSLIRTRQIQTLINKYFFKGLQKKLQSNNALGPIIDPTAGRLQPWEHWHSDRIPMRPRPVPKPEIIKDDREARELEDKLKQEVNRRLQSEKALQDEINRLRRELENARLQQQEPPRRRSPPPLRPAPVPPPQPQIRSPVPVTVRNPDRQPVYDLFLKVTNSVNKIAHSDGLQRRQLDDDTRESLKLHKLDLKIAEKQVFGRTLAPRDWDALNDHDKNVKSEEMLEIVKSRIQKRYAEKTKY